MKRVVITGVGRGIGQATAKKFLAEGYFVIGTSTSGNVSDIHNTNFASLKLDLRDQRSISETSQRVKQHYAPVDILINNAGVMLENDHLEMDVVKLRQTLEVNLIGLIDFSERILPVIRTGGHIVNISSLMGSLTNVDNGMDPAYRISKAAVNMYTRTLADRLKTKGITVSSIHPGWVRTDMGGPNAPKLPEATAQDILNLATSNVESGYLWYEGKKIAW